MKTVRVVAAVIKAVNENGEPIIFATQRGYGEFKDGWEFPGGKIEEGEIPQDALKREIREELDTEIFVGELIDTIEYDYPTFHLSMDCFWCEIVKGDLVLKEHEAARWLNKKFCMFVLGDKQKTYSFDENKYKGKIIFDPSSDIYDFQDLINKINKMNREEMQDILNYLKMEFSEKRTDEIRQNIVHVLSYLDNSWKWIERAKEEGSFFTDAYRCTKYLERYEIISGCLSREESSKLFALLTDINQLIDYMEEGLNYIQKKEKGRRHSRGLTLYVDSYTSSLSHSIMAKAKNVLDNRDIYDVLKKKIM